MKTFYLTSFPIAMRNNRDKVWKPRFDVFTFEKSNNNFDTAVKILYQERHSLHSCHFPDMSEWSATQLHSPKASVVPASGHQHISEITALHDNQNQHHAARFRHSCGKKRLLQSVDRPPGLLCQCTVGTNELRLYHVLYGSATACKVVRTRLTYDSMRNSTPEYPPAFISQRVIPYS